MTDSNKRVNVFLAISGRYFIASDITCTPEQAAEIEDKIDTLKGIELDGYLRDVMDRYGLYISEGVIDDLEVDAIQIDGDDEEFEDELEDSENE